MGVSDPPKPPSDATLELVIGFGMKIALAST
jgi:hypothetical protein